MTYNYQNLQVDNISDSILKVTLNRPEIHNAIDSLMMVELRDFWQALKEDCGELRCVILTGRGEKAFCAGADLKERQDLKLEIWQHQHKALQQAMLNMLDCPIPIIAAVNGVAYGGGLELVMACDFAYAAEHSIFAQSEVKWGIMPGALGTQHLPKAVGVRRAKELTYTAESFTAQQALEWGLINKICSAKELINTVIDVANKIADNAPLAIVAIKQSINASQHLDLKSGYQFELEAYNRLLTSEDRIEGIKAFNEKRKAEFKGL